MHDSSSSVDEFYREKLMERSAEERFMMGNKMFETARTIVLASLPANLSSRERSFKLFLRFYGHELDVNTQNRVRNLIMEREGKLINAKKEKAESTSNRAMDRCQRSVVSGQPRRRQDRGMNGMI